MKLADLDPRWLMLDGRRIGFCFVSPTQPLRPDGTANPTRYRQTCFAAPTPRRVQRELFEAMFGDDDFTVQGCNPQCGWTIAGGIEAADFATMTVTPSLDGSPGGLWHGYITNGEVK